MIIHLTEPHGDDALISCYPLLAQHAPQVRVVTVGQSRDSAGLKAHFPGLQTYYEGCYEIPNQIGRAAYHKDYRAWKKDPRCEHDSPWLWQLDVTIDHNKNLWFESFRETHKFLTRYFETQLQFGDLVMAPIGLLHPYHICVAHAVLALLKEPRFKHVQVGFYAEYPYNSSKWVEEIHQSHPLVFEGLRAGDRKLVAMMAGSGAVDSAIKERIFRTVYPTEVKILRFTHDEVLKNPYYLYVPASMAFSI